MHVCGQSHTNAFGTHTWVNYSSVGLCTSDVSKFFCGARVCFLNTYVLGFVQFIVNHSCEENDVILWWFGSKQQILPIRREENDRTENTVTKDRTEK